MIKLRRSLASIGTASLFALGLAMAGVTPAAAATTTYNVSTTDDLAYSLTTPAVCFPAPAPQVVPCSLRAAIQQANMAPSGTVTTINVPAATLPYKITIAATCTSDGDACGDFNVDSKVIISGAGQVTTVIDGNQVDRVFNVGSTGDLTMSGVTVQTGNSNNNRVCNAGGGILVTGNLLLSSSTVFNNDGGLNGGGVAEAGPATSTTTLDHVTVKGNRSQQGAGASQTRCAGSGLGTLNVINSLVTENLASSYAGGVDEDAGGIVNITKSTVSKNAAHSVPVEGISNAEVGGVTEDGGGTLNITDSLIDANASDTQAGGVAEDGGGTLKIVRSVVSNNTAGTAAAGIYLDASRNRAASKITFDHLEVSGNRVLANNISETPDFGGSGGGILDDGLDTTTMTDVYVHDNTASHGAGIYFEGVGAFTISNLTVSHNTTALLNNGGNEDGFGGGVLIDNDGGGNTVTMINSTISDNTSASQGGGLIWLPASGSRPVSVSFSTIADNAAASGGQNVQIGQIVHVAAATRHSRTARITTIVSPPPTISILASIVSGSATNCFGVVAAASQGYNLDSGTSCLFGKTGDQSVVNPRLVALTNNGGFEPTRALVPGSPAVDAVVGGCPPPTTDQRGISRPQFAACDVGAFELTPAPPVAATAPAQVVVRVPTLPKAGSGSAAPTAAVRTILGLSMMLASLVLAAGLRPGRRVAAD